MEKWLVPNWQRELLSFKGIKSTFILEGNINDIYPIFKKEDDDITLERFASMEQLIISLFHAGITEGYYEYLFCDPLFGFTDPTQTNRTAEIVGAFETAAQQQNREINELNGQAKEESHSNSKMVRNSEIIRAAMTLPFSKEVGERKSYVVTLNFASRFLSSPENMSIDETAIFLNLLYASKKAIRGNKFINTLLLIVDKFNDIPAWFYLNNPSVRIITITNPERNIRNAYISQYFNIFKESTSLDIQKTKNRFIDLTDGMKVQELNELRRLYDRSELGVEDIADIVTTYKYGFKDNMWLQMREKMSTGIEERICRRVKGQDRAVDKIVLVIKRAVSGLSGMQHSSGSKPRGILFLAGPTGTGKTEIVKTVAELLFEDENSLIRFDMSEYHAEHSDQKLFGAPPGYVGYDNGGQLTNAVKNNPFSVILFDEIEKAHPNIMDKFLQILEDGRLTDGQGNTVYFSETLIFFTSNVGISREIIDPRTHRVIGRENIVNPGEPYEEIEKKVEGAMRTYFKPEVINRIGENIVVFNYLDKKASDEIAESKINLINQNIKKSQNIDVSVSDEAYKLFYDLCWQDKPRSNGGRGISNVIEEHYLNPLAEFMFDQSCTPGSVIHVDAVNQSLQIRGATEC